MTLYDAIFVRRSVRTFTGEMKNADEFRAFIAALSLPEGCLLSVINSQKDGKIGTYGLIRRAPLWIVVSTDNDKRHQLLAASCAEELVLWCTAHGIGSCWIGGTFNKSTTGIASDADIKAVIPVGIPSKTKSLSEKVQSFFAQSSSRKPFDELFSGNFSVRQRILLESLRAAPSALNAQPWRACADGNTLIVSCESNNKYSSLDMGIGLCHMKVAAEHEGVDYHYDIAPDGLSFRFTIL